MNRKLLHALIASDLMAFGAYGLLLPIFALFLMDHIPGMTLQGVALAEALYLISKALFTQVFVSFSQQGQHKRNTWLLFVGYIVIAGVPLAYAWSTNFIQIVVAQIILGFGAGVSAPAWAYFFTASTEQKNQSSLRLAYDTVTTLALAFAAVAGGFIAYQYGYQNLFYSMSLLAAIGALISLFVLPKTIEIAKLKTAPVYNLAKKKKVKSRKTK